MDIVYHTKVAIVPGLCDRNGHRYSSAGTKQHGGKRIKSEDIGAEMWISSVALSALEDRKEMIKVRYLAGFEESEGSDNDSSDEE